MFVLPIARTTHRTVAAPLTRRAVDRLFDESLDRIFGSARAGVRTPALDVSETDDAYTLAFEVPGVSREQLKVSVQGRRVSVETVDAQPVESTQAAEAPQTADATPVAEAAPAAAKASPRVLYRERQAAKYARTVSLPAAVDESTSQARLDDGVLTLTLAKKVPTGATQLRIA